MLPKSRRALTIQEIAALARSSLHGNGSPGPGASGEGGVSSVGEGAGLLGEGIGVSLWDLGGSRGPWWHPRGGHGGPRSQGLEAGGAGGRGCRITGSAEGAWGA